MNFNQRKDIIRNLYFLNSNDIQKNESTRTERSGDFFREMKQALGEPQIMTSVTLLSWKQRTFIITLFKTL